ncbi:hypothetical protein OIU76_021522 [Salix suchowensis]|nr:hypothetical protein OIU76_021522 [Salix suchowensis]
MHKKLTQIENLKNPISKNKIPPQSFNLFFKMVSKTRLILSDFVVSLMWVWSGSLIKIFVFKVLEMEHDSRGEFLKNSLSIMNMFLFSFLGKVTKGGNL